MLEGNFGLLLILGVLAIVFALFFQLRAKRRRVQLEQVGASLGLRHIPGDDEQIRSNFAIYHLFRQGTSPRISSRVEGIFAGVQVMVLDYLFGNITNNVTNRYLVFCFISSGCQNRISIRVKSSKERVSSRINKTNTEISPSYEILHNDYVVEVSVANPLSSKLMAHMNQTAARGYSLSLECSQGRGVIYLPVTGTVTTPMFQEFLRECILILQMTS